MKIEYPTFTEEQLEKEFGKVESYEWTALNGKRLRVYFHRDYDSITGFSWMNMSQAFTVEELEMIE